jgi:hypothetical protein
MSTEAPGHQFPTPFVAEPLESRVMLAAPWSAQDRQINLDQAAANYPSITGAGETVAIIDRGVDYNNPDLITASGAHKVIDSYDFQDNTTDVFPTSDADVHGTGTAGQIAAQPHWVNGQYYQGVAPGVNLVALKTNGASDIKAALDWIIAHRSQYNIVAVNYLDMAGSNENVFAGELQSLTDSGVFIGGAVGNYGNNGTVQAIPAVNHLIYLVGSVDPNDNVSSFTPRGPAIDMLAPGENVNISWYYQGQHLDILNSGTSWAGPQVVATAALIKQINPSFTPAQIIAILRDSAHWIADPVSGMSYPRLDVNAALGLAYQRSTPVVTTPTPPTTPVTPTPTPPSNPNPTPTTTTTPSGESPFLGVPFSTGQLIEAEDYDLGGEGVAYHDNNSANFGGDNYREGGVDTQLAPDGTTRFVGWMQPGEWMNYTMDAPAAGTFDFSARVASLGRGGAFHVEIDGKRATGSIAIPDTGGWTQFQLVTRKGIKISAGTHIVRIVIDRGSATYGDAGNLDAFAFTPHATAHAKKHKAKSATTAASTAAGAFVDPMTAALLRTTAMPEA